MAFYGIVTALFTSMNTVPDKITGALIFKEHIYELLQYHYNYVSNEDIDPPPLSDIGEKYWQGYNDLVKDRGDQIVKVISEFRDKEEKDYSSYIS